MERLTKWNESSHKHAYYPRCFKDPCYGSGCKIKDCPFETAVCERLAAYEDTGLYPESVEALKLSMMGKAISEITEFDGLPIDRLRELAEADKDGRVVVLPCKVGANMIDQISKDCPRLMKNVRPAIVYVRKGVIYNMALETFEGAVSEGLIIPVSEEAEKALAEMKGETEK